MREYFENLMKDNCSIYQIEYTVMDDGINTETLVFKENTKCHYHSNNISIDNNNDKQGIIGTYTFCLPLNSSIEINDIIIVNNKNFQVTNIRDASRKFEIICEAVSYA